ncbi:MAG TPA: hypothetical protein VHE55_02735 [Fimbriimonadaceae bacterium]|nr:hypothetical protein [Fimbriimonadaceae bacterium]
MNALDLLRELVAISGPPGQETPVRQALERHVERLGLAHRADAKGNLLVGSERPRIVVTAHMDEIAMIVRRIEPDGTLAVGPLGGLFPWKLGEGPVQILTDPPFVGALSFGSIHTADEASNVRQADHSTVDWEMARVITGYDGATLTKAGVRPGTRVVIHPSRRTVTPVGLLIGSYFLDDRADLVSWLLALAEIGSMEDVLFAATAAEEVGGEGALFLLQEHRPEVCIALELGPNAPDAPVELTDQPTVWATDSYSTMSAADGDLVASVGERLGMELQFQALSRGGSDASCAASHGLCARPITLGLPMENSHGYELMHPGAMEELARLTAALIRELAPK